MLRTVVLAVDPEGILLASTGSLDLGMFCPGVFDSHSAGLSNVLTDCFTNSVKVVNTLDVTYEGSIFAYDTITNTLVLASPSSSSPKDGAKPTAQSYNLNFIKISLIKDVTVTKAAPSAQSATPNNSNPPKGPFGLAEPKIGPLNVQTIQSREAAAVRKELQDAAHVGIGVTKEGQEIYDALRKS